MESTGITVTGHGSVQRRADIARLTVGVRVADRSVAAAVTGAATSATAITDALRSRSVADDDIATTMFQVQPEYHYPTDGGEPVLRGYTVAHTLTITLRDISAVGETIDMAVAAAGDHCVVEGVGFDVADAGNDLGDARALAWENVAAKAAQLAALAGVALGPTVEITEHGAAAGPQPKLRAAAMAFADAGTGIEPGGTTASVTLTVRFAIGD